MGYFFLECLPDSRLQWAQLLTNSSVPANCERYDYELQFKNVGCLQTSFRNINNETLSSFIIYAIKTLARNVAI